MKSNARISNITATVAHQIKTRKRTFNDLQCIIIWAIFAYDAIFCISSMTSAASSFHYHVSWCFHGLFVYLFCCFCHRLNVFYLPSSFWALATSCLLSATTQTNSCLTLGSLNFCSSTTPSKGHCVLWINWINK